jgi:hypothetical protein
MSQHSNYAKDRDLMMEAYGSVQGIVPKTTSTALPRGYVLTEAHCDEESSESVEIGGKLYEVGSPDPNNESELIISIEKSVNGYMITTGQFSSPEDFVTKGPDSAVEAGGYALSLDGQQMDEDDLLTDEDIAKIDQDVSNGVGKAELEGTYGAELVAAYIADGEAKGKFEGEIEDNEHAEEQPSDDTVKVDLELDLDKDTATKLHDQLMDQLGLGHPAEDSSCASH